MQSIFYRVCITVIICSGLLVVFLLLFGRQEQTELKIIFSALGAGGSALAALCCASVYNQYRYRAVSILGMGLAGLTFVCSLLNIWGEFEGTVKLFLTLVTLTAALAHICLLLRIDQTAGYATIITLVFIVASVVCAQFVIYSLLDTNLTLRLGISFLILSVTGTILAFVKGYRWGDL